MIQTHFASPCVQSPSAATRPPVAPQAPPDCCPEEHDSVALGVVDMRSEKRVAPSTEEAALWALNAAVQAASNGSTGVGGVLLGPNKELLAVSCNRVWVDGKAVDPTAHGERQIVDWYFEHAEKGDTLPAPQDCTIVTSLDPCLMCTGSILTGGFKVISSSLDSAGGVNWDGKHTFTDLPDTLRDAANKQFSYFGVEGQSDFQGPAVFGEKPTLSQDVSSKSLNAFVDSIKAPHPLPPGAAPPPTGPAQDLRECTDPAFLAMLREHSPEALTVHCADPNNPGQELAVPLLAAAQRSLADGGKFNSAALLDPHGNLVLVRGSEEEKSPLRTPLMELTRAWSKIRAEASPEALKYLATMKDCTVVTLLGPARDGATIMEFGAYGSSVKSKVREDSAAWQYIVPRQKQEQLDAEIAALPPHYSENIHPRIAQVADPELVALVHEALPLN